MNSILAEGASRFDVILTEEMCTAFEIYASELIETNKVMNLTAITEKDEIYAKHFVDSFSCQSLIPHGASVIDVGSGAGFPGLPLAIVRPDIRVTLLDSLNKRVGFLNGVINKLKITQATAVHMRAEDGGHSRELRGKFDVAVSRAVAALPVLCEYCMPFVRVGGLFLALKGRDAALEMETAAHAVKVLGGNDAEIHETFWQDMEHRVVAIEKVCGTPSQYPRKAGKPSKEPLI